MPGVILAVPDRPECAAEVLAAAECLAQLTRSTRINVLAIRLPPEATISSEEILTREREFRIRTAEQRRAEELRRTFDAWWASRSPESAMVAESFDIEGMADRLIDEWGRRADFVVLERPTRRWLQADHRAIRAALFETDRPVLVVPAESSVPFGRRIAIAWRDDGRTIKAVLSVLRWAGRAEEIHVLAGVRDAAAPPRVPEILDEHGIAATLHVLPITGQQAFGEALLNKAHAIGADMLAMGAFARHPIRSLILGGVTRYMLGHSDLPVLMRH